MPKPKALSSPNVAVKVTSLSQGWVVWVVAAITILVMVLLKVMDVVIIVIVVTVFNMPNISEKDASIGMLYHFVRHKKNIEKHFDYQCISQGFVSQGEAT